MKYYRFINLDTNEEKEFYTMFEIFKHLDNLMLDNFFVNYEIFDIELNRVIIASK